MSEVETETPDEAQEPAGEPESPDEPDGADEPDEEPDEPQEAAQTPVPVGLTPELLEKRSRSAEKRFETYERGIRGLYDEEAANFLPCPLCPSDHKGLVDVRFAGRIPDEIEADVKAYLGLARPVELRQSTRTRECPSCGGEGDVLSGSKKATQKIKPCEDCKGYGFVPPPGEAQGNGMTGPTQFSPETLERVLQEPDDRDEWGEPRILPDGRENPNFGRMPNRKVLVDPWGVTAGLSAFDAVS